MKKVREFKLLTPAMSINTHHVVDDIWKAIGQRKQPKPFARSQTTVDVELLVAALTLLEDYKDKCRADEKDGRIA